MQEEVAFSALLHRMAEKNHAAVDRSVDDTILPESLLPDTRAGGGNPRASFQLLLACPELLIVADFHATMLHFLSLDYQCIPILYNIRYERLTDINQDEIVMPMLAKAQS